MSDTRANFRQVKFIPKRIHIVEINSARWNGWDGNSFRFYCRTIGRHTWPDRIKSRKAHTWTNPNGRWWIYLFLKRRMVRSTINFVCIIYEILVCITIHLCMHYFLGITLLFYSKTILRQRLLFGENRCQNYGSRRGFLLPTTITSKLQHWNTINLYAWW
jgi:hypothetical protein